MIDFDIKTPNSSFKYSSPNSEIEFSFSDNFDKDINKLFQTMQVFVDSECIRLVEPYTPKDSGALISSIKNQTTIGNGLLIQQTPYAKKQYFENEGSGIRGAKWFENMKIRHEQDIHRGLERIIK